jgi:hypothetical protein
MSLSFTSVRGLAGIAVLCFAAALAGRLAASPPQEPKPVVFPANDVGVESLAARKAAQEKAAREWKVFHDFHFSDRVEESGITFVHRITDDSGKNYKANHYDHGTGIAVADVDGDGLPDIYFVSQLGGNELWKNSYLSSSDPRIHFGLGTAIPRLLTIRWPSGVIQEVRDLKPGRYQTIVEPAARP